MYIMILYCVNWRCYIIVKSTNRIQFKFPPMIPIIHQQSLSLWIGYCCDKKYIQTTSTCTFSHVLALFLGISYGLTPQGCLVQMLKRKKGGLGHFDQAISDKMMLHSAHYLTVLNFQHWVKGLIDAMTL